MPAGTTSTMAGYCGPFRPIVKVAAAWGTKRAGPLGGAGGCGPGLGGDGAGLGAGEPQPERAGRQPEVTWSFITPVNMLQAAAKQWCEFRLKAKTSRPSFLAVAAHSSWRWHSSGQHG